jgi:cytoskeletal protein CcmA (bactofilin family)
MARRLLIALSLLSIIGFGTAAHAATVQASNTYSLGSGQTTQGNLYIAGRNATIAGHVTGEVVVAGGTVDISGPVDQSVTVLAGTVTVSGPVGGNLHVLGGSVTINSTVAGDLLIGAGSVSIPAGGVVGGDIVGATGTLSLSGKVGGDLRVYGGSITVDGTVGGSVIAQASNLTLTESAQVAHDVRYRSHQKATISPAAKIGGVTDYTHTSGSNYASFTVLGLIFRLILLYAAALVLIALFRRQTTQVAETYDRRFLPALLTGFGFIILTPIVAVLLLLTIVGAYLAIMLFFAYVLVILLSIAYSAICLGHLIVRRFGDGPMSPYLSSLIGVALIVLLTLIPILGGIAGFILIVTGAGAIILPFFGRGAPKLAAPETTIAAEAKPVRKHSSTPRKPRK